MLLFYYEFSIICNKMGLSATEVTKACKYEMEFLNFKPGLVGGALYRGRSLLSKF